jgi:hypothetical protein
MSALSAGQGVHVYPHGIPSQMAAGTVALISGNQLSIAVAFDSMPPFAFRSMPVVGFHPEHGIILLAMRQAIDGKPWGPWIELGNGGHYEIEAIETEKRGGNYEA